MTLTLTPTPTDYRRISMSIHGWWGAGKSWLADTAPGPRLILDAEGGVYDTPSPKVRWDPYDPIPSVSEETSVVVDVQEWDPVRQSMAVLLSGKHPFESVIVDSMTEAQKQLKQAIARPGEAFDPNAVFDQQAWGRLLNNMELTIRQLRDLTRPTARRRVNVIVVLGSDTEAVPAKPLLQGGLRKSLAGFFDIQGFLFVGRDDNQNEVRVLQISPDSLAEAKCRLHKLKVAVGAHMMNPTIPDILSIINNQEA